MTTELQDHYDRELRRSADRLANRIKDASERIRRLADEPPYGGDGQPIHFYIVGQIISEIRGMNGGMTELEQIVLAAGVAYSEASK